jgi:hypothetical protein
MNTNKPKHREKIPGVTFNTSHKWFQGFKTHAKLHNFKMTGEAVGADTAGATEDYLSQQIFSINKT